MKIKDTTPAELYELIDELEQIKSAYNFNSLPFPYRMGVKRMRVYLDHVVSGLRMVKGGPFEPHNIASIHNRKRQ